MTGKARKKRKERRRYGQKFWAEGSSEYRAWCRECVGLDVGGCMAAWELNHL